MSIFHYKSDIFPITIFVSYFFLDLFVYFFVENIFFLIGYALVSVSIKGFISAWNHHHQHSETFRIPLLNRILELIYGFHTGITGYAWVLHHNLGHHLNYLDQSLDESAWKSPSGVRYGPIKYTWIVASTAYYRAWKVGKKYKKIQKYFLIMCAVQFSILALFLIIKPLSGLLIFVVPMITSLALTAYATYYHHGGLETKNHLEASNNMLSPWYNLITGNLGYHTAHHMKGGLHWSKLPEYHAEIAEGIDAKYYMDFKIL